MAIQGPQERALARALKTAPVKPEDAATAALARRYARLLDEAAPAARYVKAVGWLARLRLDDDDDEGARHVETIRTALAEHSVASDLGPKLLAALGALGMSPAGRAAVTGKGAQPAPEKSKSALQRQRDELADRRARQAAQ